MIIFDSMLLSMDLIDVCGIGVIAIGWFIFTPLLIYYLYRFIRLKHTEIMKHRKYKLVYLKNALSIIGILFERAFICSVMVWNIQVLQHYKWLIYVLDGVFVWGVFVLFSMKIWLLFYSIGYHESLAKSTWKKHINPNYKSWYISHKNTCGNFSCIAKVSWLPFIAYILIEMYVERFYFQYISIHCLIVSSLILLLPSLILYCKLKPTHDVFGIRREISYQCAILFIVMVLYIGILASNFFMIHLIDRLEWLIQIFIGSVILFLMSFISTFFPVQHKKQLNELINPSNAYMASLEDAPHTHGVKSMIHVLRDEQGFKGFMMHLVHEFTTESLLFITEYIQIKHEFQLKCNQLLKLPKPKSKVPKSITQMEFKEAEDEFVTVDLNVECKGNHRQRSCIATSSIGTYIFNSSGSIFGRVELPSSLPKSELLDKKESFVDRLHELYLKYIERGSALEINISCIQRKRIAKAFKKVLNHRQRVDSMESDGCIQNEETQLNFDMFTVMDGACIEMLLLISQSYTRFTQSQGGRAIPIVNKLNSIEDDNELSEYRRRHLSLEILRNGSSYSKLR
eukprot:501811_1